MKKLFLAAMVGMALGAGTVTSAQAYTVDNFLFSANLGNSGDATELAALTSFLGLNPGDLAMDLKLNTGDVGFNVAADGAGQWVIDVAPLEPGYFLLKFGTGGTGVTDDTYYFENIAELSKLVWTNDQVNFLTGGNCGARNQNACNIGRLSHYALFSGGGGGQDVPEPGTLGLFGLALAGLGALRRRLV